MTTKCTENNNEPGCIIKIFLNVCQCVRFLCNIISKTKSIIAAFACNRFHFNYNVPGILSINSNTYRAVQVRTMLYINNAYKIISDLFEYNSMNKHNQQLHYGTMVFEYFSKLYMSDITLDDETRSRNDFQA